VCLRSSCPSDTAIDHATNWKCVFLTSTPWIKGLGGFQLFPRSRLDFMVRVFGMQRIGAPFVGNRADGEFTLLFLVMFDFHHIIWLSFSVLPHKSNGLSYLFFIT